MVVSCFASHSHIPLDFVCVCGIEKGGQVVMHRRGKEGVVVLQRSEVSVIGFRASTAPSNLSLKQAQSNNVRGAISP